MKKVIKGIFFLIIAVWILINILSVMNLSFFGIRIFKIGSGSMEPNLKVNDIIIIKKENDYKLNDVVTYENDGYYVTHRIIEIDENTVITKGDNNSNSEIVEKNKIIGKMIYKFKILGFFIYMLTKPYSWIVLFLVSILFIFVMPVKTEKGKHLNN